MTTRKPHSSWDAYPLPAALPEPVIRDSSRPLVTVVTPSFNQARFIRETIESVLAQDYPNLEHWVIDGGSNDGTIEVLRSYENDPRFHWLSEKDRGQADALNKGWRRARGQVLGWLNSDDVYCPGVLAGHVAELERNPAVGIVYGDTELIDEHSRHIGHYHTRPFDRLRFLHLAAIGQPSALMRSSLVEEHGGLDLNLHFALDYEFFLRMMWHTEFIYRPGIAARFRVHGASKTGSNYPRMLRESVEVVTRICGEHPKELGHELPRALSDWYWMGAMQSLESKRYREALENSLSALRQSPLRPRMGIFGLKVLESVLHVPLAEPVISMLDRRARASSKRR